MKAFDQLASNESINTTINALNKNGITALVVENGEAARQKVYELIPEGSEVMVMTSETLRTLGIEKEIQESGKFNAVKAVMAKMGKEKADLRQKKIMGAAAEFSIGSVHAVTEDGKVLVASNTGSQLPGYVFGSDKVIWVVGAQKIVANMDEGIKRIYDYVLPLETPRLRKAYNLPETVSSFVSKLLIFNREVAKDRITLIFVKEVLGF